MSKATLPPLDVEQKEEGGRRRRRGGGAAARAKAHRQVVRSVPTPTGVAARPNSDQLAGPAGAVTHLSIKRQRGTRERCGGPCTGR